MANVHVDDCSFGKDSAKYSGNVGKPPNKVPLLMILKRFFSGSLCS